MKFVTISVLLLSLIPTPNIFYHLLLLLALLAIRQLFLHHDLDMGIIVRVQKGMTSLQVSFTEKEVDLDILVADVMEATTIRMSEIYRRLVVQDTAILEEMLNANGELDYHKVDQQFDKSPEYSHFAFKGMQVLQLTDSTLTVTVVAIDENSTEFLKQVADLARGWL